LRSKSDTGSFESFGQAAVSHAVRACGGVETLDPKIDEMCACGFCGRDRPNTAPSSPRPWRNEKVLSGGRGKPFAFFSIRFGAHGLPGHL
jgi:hypothetical protein